MESRVSQLPGQRFCPMDDELVLFYLKPMLSGQNVSGRNRVVFDYDLYGQQEPCEIWEDLKTRRPHDLRLNKDIYFFTQHKKMSSTDKRIRRNVGSGITWHSDDSKPVRSVETGGVVGLKKRLSYKNEDSVQKGRCWILFEFFLDRSLRDKKEKVKDYVLCCLRKNGEPKEKIGKKRKQPEEEEFLEENCGGDGEISSREQEVLLEPQGKRQRTTPSIDNAAEIIFPSEDDDDAAAFAANLEEALECCEFDNAPSSEAEAISFQAEENGGQQPLTANHGISNLLPDEDFLMVEMEEFLLNDVSSNINEGEQNVVNSSLLNASPSSMSAAYDGCTDRPYVSSENGCIDPSGSNNVCGGLIGFEDGVCMAESLVEVPTYEQQKTADEDFSDWLGSIDFSPKTNNFFAVCEMQLV